MKEKVVCIGIIITILSICGLSACKDRNSTLEASATYAVLNGGIGKVTNMINSQLVE